MGHTVPFGLYFIYNYRLYINSEHTLILWALHFQLHKCIWGPVRINFGAVDLPFGRTYKNTLYWDRKNVVVVENNLKFIISIPGDALLTTLYKHHINSTM